MSAELVAFLVATASLGVIAYDKFIRPRLRARAALRDAERFQTRPRIDDLAGYEISPGTYMVGRVIGWYMLGDGRDPAVDLQVPFTTATGGVHRDTRWSVAGLRYFPPGTPLGVNTDVPPESPRSRRSVK